MGERVFIGVDVLIDDADPWGVVIEDDVTVLARAVILAHAYYPRHLQGVLEEASGRSGVTLKRGSYVAVGAIILPGVTVGEHAVVGAGSIVTKDVPPYSVVVGSPAKVVRTFTPEEVAEPPK
ncbi:MAG: acyltransferase [Chrysiogenetes bacterium]|nr:acyltransferase [Chrysiogenetes bacterium]